MGCSYRENINLAWLKSTYPMPRAHLMRIQSSFLLIRMTSSLCYFWCLPVLSPSFRPLTDKSHGRQQTQRLYTDGHVEKSIHQQRVGRGVMNLAAPQLNTTAVCCTYQTIIVCSGFHTKFVLTFRVLPIPLCVCVCSGERQTHRDLMNK